MPRRGSRQRIARNIYRDGSGISGFVNVRGHREELRFPPNTPTRTIQRDLDARRRQLDLELGEAPVRGSVRAVAQAAIDKLGTSRSDQDRKGRLRAWIAACGDDLMVRLSRARLMEVCAAWQQAGTAPNTIAKRISTLRGLWRSIAPDDAPLHASERIKRPRTAKGSIIRGRPMDLVMLVLANLARENPRGEESKAAARLALMAWTGQPPALLQLVRPEHVRWTIDPPELYVQPRRKGEGVDAAWLPLVPPAVAALKRFFAAKATGTWNRGVITRAWNRAKKKTRADLLKAHESDLAAMLDGFRPYDLRHSLLTALGTATGDLHAVAEYGRHSDIRTSLIYVRGSASPRVRAAIAQLVGILPTVPQIGSASPRTKTGRKGTTRTKRGQQVTTASLDS